MTTGYEFPCPNCEESIDYDDILLADHRREDMMKCPVCCVSAPLDEWFEED